MMKYIYLIAWLIGLGSVAYGQAQPTKDKKFMVRKGFESLDDKKDPATMSFTFPKEGPNAYLINAGISYAFTKTEHLKDKSKKNSVLLSFVVNKNTMIKEEQDNYRLSLTSNIKVGRTDSSSSHYKILSFTAGVSRNVVDTTRSAYLTGYFSFQGNKENSLVPSFSTYNVFRKGKPWLYFVGFSVGPEYQHRFNSNTETEIGVFRAFYSFEFRIRKKKEDEIGDPVFDLIMSNKGRYDLFHSTAAKEGYLPLLKYELEFYPTGSSEFSIGLSYNTGSDPIAGLAKQDFWLLAMKFKK